MCYNYNPNCFINNQLYDSKLKQLSFKTYKLNDGHIIALFQGSRGDNPDLDFIVKYLEPGLKSRIRTPKHIHWVVDLLLKMEHSKENVFYIIKYYNSFYDDVVAFTNVVERNSFTPQTYSIISEQLNDIELKGKYSLDFICYIIELFIYCEKQSPREKKMFKDLLKLLLAYSKGEKDFFQVINGTAPGY